MARSEYYVRPTNGDDTNDGLTHAAAWKTVQHALDTITMDTTNGDRINICDESTLTIAADWSLTTFGNPSYPGLVFQGYTAVSGDGGIFHIDANDDKLIDESAHDYISFIDGKVTNWDDYSLAIRLDDGCNIINMEFDGGGDANKGVRVGTGGIIQGCVFKNLASGYVYGNVVQTGNYYVVINNYIEVNPSNTGLKLTYNNIATGNMFLMNAVAATAIKLQNAPHSLIANNTILASASCNGKGIYISGTVSSGCTIINNYMEGLSNSGYGIYCSSAANISLLLSNNYYYNNTTNESIVGGIVRTINDPVTLLASGVMNNAWMGGDLDLSPTKGLINNAFVTQLATGDTVHSKDVGAVQRAKGVIGGPNMQAGRAR